jgi:hypothetical protein
MEPAWFEFFLSSSGLAKSPHVLRAFLWLLTEAGWVLRSDAVSLADALVVDHVDDGGGYPKETSDAHKPRQSHCDSHPTVGVAKNVVDKIGHVEVLTR